MKGVLDRKHANTAMSKPLMDYENALSRIYEYLERDQVEAAVMECCRLARRANDYLNAAIFSRELHPDGVEVRRALFDDMSHLKKDEQEFIWRRSFDHWHKAHSTDTSLTAGDDANDKAKQKVLQIAVGDIDPDISQCEAAIADLKLPEGMSPYDTAAFMDEIIREKGGFRLRIMALQKIRTRVKTYCLNYAIQIERQLASQRKNQKFLDAVQNEVNNYFKARSEDVFLKLDKASQLSASQDLEDASLLLTEVRRALKAAADYFYPPTAKKVPCSDGQERLLGEDQYMNRLQEFLMAKLTRSTARELLKAELDHLITFLRRLNDIASKGVHNSVDLAEARQGLVGLYFFLFNICQHLSKVASPE